MKLDQFWGGARASRGDVIATLLAGYLAIGCASGRAFVPAEHVTGLSPTGGRPAAEYTVRDASHVLAEVKLWSHGATRNSSDDDDGATVIRVGFEIHNPSAAPVRLDTQSLELRDVELEEGGVQRVPLLGVEGTTEIAAGRDAQITAAFRLPGDLWPSEIKSYRVAWALINGGTHRHKTRFLGIVREYDPWPPPPYYYSYPPPYYPYYYPPGGFYRHYRYRPWPPGYPYRRYYRGWP